MNIRLSVEKDKKVLSSGTYEIINGTDWENACSDIWRRTRQEQPLNSLDVSLSTLIEQYPKALFLYRSTCCHPLVEGADPARGCLWGGRCQNCQKPGTGHNLLALRQGHVPS